MSFVLVCLDGELSHPKKYLQANCRLVADYITETGALQIEVPFKQEKVLRLLDYIGALVTPDTKEGWIALVEMVDYFGLEDKYLRIMKESLEKYIKEEGIILYSIVPYNLKDYITKLTGNLCKLEYDTLVLKISTLRKDFIGVRESGKGMGFLDLYQHWSLMVDSIKSTKDESFAMIAQHMSKYFPMLNEKDLTRESVIDIFTLIKELPSDSSDETLISWISEHPICAKIIESKM